MKKLRKIILNRHLIILFVFWGKSVEMEIHKDSLTNKINYYMKDRS